MKRTVLILVSLMAMSLGNRVSAQGKYGADSAECIKYLSYYTEYFKQKSYDEAVPSWRQAYRICPASAREGIFVDGAKLIRNLIKKNSKNVIYKEALVDTLLTLHDQRIAAYPKHAVTAYNNKGLDMANYIKDDNRRLYDGYNEIIEFNGNQTKPNILLFDLVAAIELNKEGAIDEEEVVGIYNRNLALLDESPVKTDVDKEQKDKVRGDMETIFANSPVANCDNLINLFTPRFEANPEDGELASRIVNLMFRAEDCMSNELFSKAASVMYKNNPSAASAHMLYQVYAQLGKVDSAIKYMNEAINSSETDAATDAEYLYELSVFCYKTGRNAASLDYAGKCVNLAADNNTLTGKAYMLMGTIWANTKCGGNEISTRAPFWVAVDYMNKARKADASLSADASKMIAQYSQYFPQTAEAFMYDLQDGQTYTVNCGEYHATTIVRTQK